MGTNKSRWTNDEIEHLKRLCNNKDLSFNDIAVILGRERNACIGKAHRLKHPKVVKERRQDKPTRVPGERKPYVKRDPSAWKARSAKQRERMKGNAYGAARSKPVEPPIVVVPVTVPDERPGIPFEHVKGCMWPLRDGNFCGEEIARKRYCAHHASVAFIPLPPRKSKPRPFRFF